MNPQPFGDRLQALIERMEQRQKYVYDIALGVVSPRSDFVWHGAAGMADPGCRWAGAAPTLRRRWG